MFEVNGINFSNFYTAQNIATNDVVDNNVEYTAGESDDTVMNDSLNGPFFKGNNRIELYDHNKNGVYEELDYYDNDENLTYYADFNDTTGKLSSYRYFESNMPQVVYVVTIEEDDSYSVEVEDSRSPLLQIMQQIRECFIGPQEFDQNVLKDTADDLQDMHDEFSGSEYEELFEEPEETEDEAGNKTKNKLEDKIEDESKEHQIK